MKRTPFGLKALSCAFVFSILASPLPAWAEIPDGDALQEVCEQQVVLEEAIDGTIATDDVAYVEDGDQAVEVVEEEDAPSVEAADPATEPISEDASDETSEAPQALPVASADDDAAAAANEAEAALAASDVDTAAGTQIIDEGPDSEEAPVAPPLMQGWVHVDSKTYYYVDGDKVTGEQNLVPEKGTKALWYWFDDTGLMLKDRDVLVPNGDGTSKWVRLNTTGAMVTGEQCITDPARGNVGWYYFDENTRAMAHGLTKLNSNGGKIAYYDPTTGVMLYGELYLREARVLDGTNYTAGWRFFNTTTGAMIYGWKYLSADNGKWVYYDLKTGAMSYGEVYVKGSGGDGWCYFDDSTGALQYGWKYLTSDFGKWVYYDESTGRMVTGERYITSGEHGWCYFNEYSGAVQYGLNYLSKHNKTVFYDLSSGRMRYGLIKLSDKVELFFDTVTGAMQADGFQVLINAMSLPESFKSKVLDLPSMVRPGMKVRIIGDSIAGGWGVATPVVMDGQVFAQQGSQVWREPSALTPMWTSLLRSYIEAAGGSLLVCSAPGKGFDWYDTISPMLPDAAQGHFDLTIVMLGSNDTDKTRDEYRTVAASVLGKAMASSDHVVAVVPSPRRDPLGTEMDIPGQRVVLQALCQERGIANIDACSWFETALRSAGLESHRLSYKDGLHPSMVGQAALWAIIARGLGIL